MPKANLPHSGRASSKDQPSQQASMGDKAAASSVAIRKYLIKITSELGPYPRLPNQYWAKETTTAATAERAATIVHRAADCAPAAAAVAALADSSAAFRKRCVRSSSADSPSRRRRWCCSSSHSQAKALPVSKCPDSSLACTTSSPSFSHSRRTSSRLSIVKAEVLRLVALTSVGRAPGFGEGAQR